ncbi:uroporphyrinogen-III C-methyltransferase [Cellulosimicrobium cellulans]|uniref:uroporphyrinogen-III C-methyltransferase n=1 Tax=Cellulosimicrobium cellulans TaxID=1710 RepID=UPI002407617A|nr:uroporphyrinogen-III C-methyltransferase [Cellulosimicrobium cellulans]MDF9875847.1 uroporphyrin-III C-methyltransferase/precorrin-2 dehydrogenase/sirohydrochlorin ferrochelatase [Cellulosimicrobium cellulans]
MTTLLGLDLAGRTVLVAGGGPVAARRARAMADDGAHVRVVAPQVCEDLRDLVAASLHAPLLGPGPASSSAQRLPDGGAGPGGRVTWAPREVRESDVEDAWLVLAATDDSGTNRDVAAWAAARRTWCVNAGAAHEGTARTPATTHSGDVLVGVVTDVPAACASADGHARGRRADGSPAERRGADPRRARAVRDAIAEHLRSGGADQRRHRPASGGLGSVTLVGGGPGAVDLLTVRGRRALAEADVVVADRLGPVDVLDELAPGVEVIDVGKTPGNHPVPQHEINAILVEQAQRGRRVVRLKGGDPFVYGRGGEEVVACREAGVPVDVVPGVSSALSVPALAGIPLTHRGTVAAFHVVSGHDGLDAAALAGVRDRTATLVVLMGVSQLARLTAQALGAGADPALPVAIVESGSTPRQRVTRAPLGEVVERAAQVGVRAPAIIVVGDVAAEGRLDPATVA